MIDDQERIRQWLYARWWRRVLVAAAIATAATLAYVVANEWRIAMGWTVR